MPGYCLQRAVLAHTGHGALALLTYVRRQIDLWKVLWKASFLLPSLLRDAPRCQVPILLSQDAANGVEDGETVRLWATR